MKKLGKLFRISPKEAEALLKHLRSAWRHEELIPQPEGYILIPLKRIRPPSWAIREELGDLEKLKESIQRTELLQPICVKPVDKEWRNFEPVMGVRRYFACKELGLKQVPCFIRPHVDKEQVAILALEENRYRKDLTEVELLRSVQALKARGYTLERIGEHARMSVADVSIYLRIPKLPKQLRDAFFSREISLAHVKVLASLKQEVMLGLLKLVRKEHLSSRVLEDLVAAQEGRLEIPSFLDSKELRKLIGSKLIFRRRGKQVSLMIRASSEDELLEILEKLRKK